MEKIKNNCEKGFQRNKLNLILTNSELDELARLISKEYPFECKFKTYMIAKIKETRDKQCL